jgi:predicted ATPase
VDSKLMVSLTRCTVDGVPLESPVCSLARLWGRTKRTGKARTLLQATCDKFTEGFATSDMKQARELLKQLS